MALSEFMLPRAGVFSSSEIAGVVCVCLCSCLGVWCWWCVRACVVSVSGNSGGVLVSWLMVSQRLGVEKGWGWSGGERAGYLPPSHSTVSPYPTTTSTTHTLKPSSSHAQHSVVFSKLSLQYNAKSKPINSDKKIHDIQCTDTFSLL